MMNRMTMLKTISGTASIWVSLTVNAQTWMTVDNFQYVSGKNALCTGLATDASGNLYGAGQAQDAAGVWHATIMHSPDQGLTWSSRLVLSLPSRASSGTAAVGLDSSQNLFEVTSYSNRWVVLKSGDQGINWSVADDFALPGYNYTLPGGHVGYLGVNNSCGFAADSSGNIFVVGYAYGSPTGLSPQWLVRRSTDAGQSWSTVASFSGIPVGIVTMSTPTGSYVFTAGNGPAGSPDAWSVYASADGGGTWSTVESEIVSPVSTNAALMTGFGADAAGNLYTAGFEDVPASKKGSTTYYQYYWVIRKSSDGGSIWQVSDLYQYSHYANGGGYWAEVPTVGCDQKGNVYAAGSFPDAKGVLHWLVRKSADQGATWSLSDDFRYSAGSDAYAGCFAADPSGNIYIGGRAMNSAGTEHWLVRKSGSH